MVEATFDFVSGVAATAMFVAAEERISVFAGGLELATTAATAFVIVRAGLVLVAVLVAMTLVTPVSTLLTFAAEPFVAGPSSRMLVLVLASARYEAFSSATVSRVMIIGFAAM